ncbi:MAG: hypothetical protein IKL21_06730 [Clostridia bacterium]|nr:hypothetical protein [Clostridia bacterium]
MKKLFVLLAVIAALTVNTCAYTPSFTVTGDDILSSPVFSVRISAMITETRTEETTSPEMTEGETVSTDEITDTDSGTASVSAPAEDIPAVISDAVSEDVTNVDTVTDTEENTDTQTDTDTSAGTQKSGIFGGEGTVVFDTSKVVIMSVLPCTPDGVTVEFAGTDGEFRFMFYSENELEPDTPLLDMKFKIISKSGDVSLTLSEGIFSDGNLDTPAESVTFTAVYEAKETTPVTTSRPAESVTSAVTTAQDESEHQTENRTEATQRPDLPTEGDAKTEPTEPNEPDGTSLLPVIIVVTAAVITAAVTAVIFIVKRTKK